MVPVRPRITRLAEEKFPGSSIHVARIHVAHAMRVKTVDACITKVVIDMNTIVDSALTVVVTTTVAVAVAAIVPESATGAVIVISIINAALVHLTSNLRYLKSVSQRYRPYK